MNAVFARLGLWLWHLLPANPILVRVVHGMSQRSKHLWLRVGYLTILFVVVVFLLMNSNSNPQSSLADLAKGAAKTFQWAAFTQLALICFLSPAFTAAAITQERNAQTFNILLSTPLSNAQIVFGSLMSRLFFVLMLLVSGLPIFLMTMVYGGVTGQQIIENFALAGATAALTGAVAIFTAMLTIGTRTTTFSFYLLIFAYLLVIGWLGQQPFTFVEAAPANIDGHKISWLTPFHPFLCMQVAINQIQAPSAGELIGFSSLWKAALCHSSTFYVVWTMFASLVLTTASIVFVRSGAKTGEVSWLGNLKEKVGLARPKERSRAPRSVWNNPVAWREAKTKSIESGNLRWLVLAGGVVACLAVFFMYGGGALPVADNAGPDLAMRSSRAAVAVAAARHKQLLTHQAALRGVISYVFIAQFLIAMFIATYTAATSMTKEKESKTMDMLLTTMLTSKYILWGKLRGLVSFYFPFVIGPVAVILFFVLYGLLNGHHLFWPEASLELGVLMLVYIAFACVLALQISLKSKTNVVANMWSVGTMIVVMLIVSAIGYGIVSSAPPAVAAFLSPFSPLTAIRNFVDYTVLFDGDLSKISGPTAAVRINALVGTIIATTVYTFIVWHYYYSLVRNFDMIVRKQSGT